MVIKQNIIKHFVACFIVACGTSVIESWCGSSYSQSLLAGIIAGGAIGVGKEYGDKCAIENKWDWSDIGADALGSIVGASLGSLFTLLKH